MDCVIILLEPAEAVQLLIVIQFVSVANALLDVIRIPFSLHHQLLLLSLYPLSFELDHGLLVVRVTSIFTNVGTILALLCPLLLARCVRNLGPIVVCARSSVEFVFDIVLGAFDFLFIELLFIHRQ